MRAALRNPGWLFLPLGAFLGIFYILPVLMMLAQSVGAGFDFAPWRQALTSSLALNIFAQTLTLAVVCTIVTLALAYPFAFVAATSRPMIAGLLFAIVMLPFWTSILIRSYAWMALLGRQGVVNGMLRWLGAVDDPLKLLNTRFAVYVGMIHILLPFMVLPIHASLRSMDARLVAAAENLGAGPISVFRYVILPLSLPGVTAGCVLVFVLALGFYITPALLGGPSDMTISMLVAQEVELYHWDYAAALAALLLAFTAIALLVFGRLTGLERLLGMSR